MGCTRRTTSRRRLARTRRRLEGTGSRNRASHRRKKGVSASSFSRGKYERNTAPARGSHSACAVSASAIAVVSRCPYSTSEHSTTSKRPEFLNGARPPRARRRRRSRRHAVLCRVFFQKLELAGQVREHDARRAQPSGHDPGQTRARAQLDDGLAAHALGCSHRNSAMLRRPRPTARWRPARPREARGSAARSRMCPPAPRARTRSRGRCGPPAPRRASAPSRAPERTPVKKVLP